VSPNDPNACRHIAGLQFFSDLTSARSVRLEVCRGAECHHFGADDNPAREDRTMKALKPFIIAAALGGVTYVVLIGCFMANEWFMEKQWAVWKSTNTRPARRTPEAVASDVNSFWVHHPVTAREFVLGISTLVFVAVVVLIEGMKKTKAPNQPDSPPSHSEVDQTS
jgi:hypothetical protein